MRTIIEQLNQWGETVVPIAAQLLWQTSLLIVVLLAFDLMLGNRVRAGFRYALWMLLLVKLVLPPTIALPTGIGYWIDRSHAEKPKPQPAVTVPKFEVTYPIAAAETPVFPDVQSFDPLPAIETPPPPAPKLIRAGWLLVASVSGTLLLLGWILWRWRWVNRIIKTSTSANDELQTLAADCFRALASARSSVLPAACRPNDRLEACPTLQITDVAMSPAVCGLFRPVVLLPRLLVHRLSIEQLRTVLLHELIHLRRRDLWVNCLQSLLQIVCWWHPLIWLANARIRRVREEAVDEAVASALRDDADTYPATLLEVAKLTFTRPLMTLGLVGILESKNALKQRIRRLLDLAPLESTRLKWWQWTALVAFALAALPMAQGQNRPTPKESTVIQTNQGAETHVNSSESTIDSAAAPGDLQDTNSDAGVSDKLVNRPETNGLNANRSAPASAIRPNGSSTNSGRPIQLEAIAIKMSSGTWNTLIGSKSIRANGNNKGSYRDDRPPNDLVEWLKAQVDATTLFVPKAVVREGQAVNLTARPAIQYPDDPRGSVEVNLQASHSPDNSNNFALTANATITEIGQLTADGKLKSLDSKAELESPKVQEYHSVYSVKSVAYLSHSIKGDEIRIPADRWAILTNPTDKHDPGTVYAILVKATTEQLLDAPENSESKRSEPAPNSTSLPLKHHTLPQSPPTRLDNTNFATMRLQMITDQTPWPDSRYKGYHPIGLEPRFVLLPIEGLKKALNGQLPVAQPLIVASNRLDALTNSLIEAGAMDHSSAEPMRFSKMSGGVFLWSVASNAVSHVQYQATPRGTTNEIVFGARQDMTAYTSNWSPLTLLARPFTADDNSLHCLLSFETGAYDAADFAKTEADIPMGAALVWVSTNEVRPGFAQAVILKNTGSPPADEAAGKSGDPSTDQVATAPQNADSNAGRQKIMEKLNKFRLAELFYEGVPLSKVVRELTDESRRLDPAHKGINFMIAPQFDNSPGAATFATDPATGQPVAVALANSAQTDLGGTIIDIQSALTNLRMIDALNAICLAANHPIKFNVEDFGVIITPKGPEALRLVTRVFRINPNTFYRGLEAAFVNTNNQPISGDERRSGKATNETSIFAQVDISHLPFGTRVPGHTKTNDMSLVNISVRKYFESAGVKFEPPKMLYFNDRTGVLLVRATPEDLETIQHAVEALNYEPPQITLEALCLELTADEIRNAGLDLYMGSENGPDSTAGTNTVTGILTPKQFKAALAALRIETADVSKATDKWRVTTFSERPTHVKFVSAETIVTGLTNTASGPTPITKDMEFGNVLDLLPQVSSDGYTVTVDVDFSHTEFLGYEDPALAHQPTGTPLPRILTRSVKTRAAIGDGQTLVFRGMTIERPIVFKSKVPVLGSIPLIGRAFRRESHETQIRHIVVFITPTIIDPAGNQVHQPVGLQSASDEDAKSPAKK